MGKKKKKEQVVYSYKAGARQKIPAQAVGEELESIRVRDGGLKTDAVVDAARPDTAVLHPAFEWDDFNAAESFRKIQARTLIRQVRVENTNYATDSLTGGDIVDKPAFIHVKVHREQAGYYQTPEVIVQNIDEFQAAISEAIGKLMSAQRAVDELEAIASKTKDKERLSMISLACHALETANNALKTMQ